MNNLYRALIVCSVLILCATGCNQPNKSLTQSTEREVGAPIIHDSKQSLDGRTSVTNDGPLITVTFAENEPKTFNAPMSCGAGGNHYTWMGTENTIYHFIRCPDKGTIYRLNIENGALITQRTVPAEAILLSGNGALGKAAFYLGTQQENALMIFDFIANSSKTILTKPQIEKGNGRNLVISRAEFSPDGSKIYYVYTEQGPEIQQDSQITISYQTYYAIYNLKTSQNRDMATLFTSSKDEYFYGWQDNETIVTKQGEYYRVYRL